jgi:glycine/D-amino acid oxidase-like deaminating enzyme
MFTLSEADGYHFGSAAGASPFSVPVSEGGWRIAAPEALTANDYSWVSANSAIPRWLGRAYTRDILSFNRRAGELWSELLRTEPGLFARAGRRDGILRLYTEQAQWDWQFRRQKLLGAHPRRLEPEEISRAYPALADAATAGVVVGGIETDGFTVQIHPFVTALLDLLDRAGVTFSWRRHVSRVHRDADGVPCGIQVADEVIHADHLVLSTGAYGHDLLAGTASHGLIHGVLGVWLTLPNVDGLGHSLKISRTGHRAEDSNVTVAGGPDGTPLLIVGSGYGWTGHDPGSIDAAELDVLHDAVADTARTFFPRAHAHAHASGLLVSSRRFCVRPWTASSLGVFETAAMAGAGVVVVTGGHNTGGFAQAPVIGEAVSAALRGWHHPMHTLYHPDRLTAFLRARSNVRPTPTHDGPTPADIDLKELVIR